jgi:hypothetical protein
MLLPLLALLCVLPLAPLLRRFYSRRMVALMSLHEVAALPSAGVPTLPAPVLSASNEPSLAQCLRERQVRLVRATIIAFLCANAVALAMVAADVFRAVTPSSYLFWLVLVCSPFLVNLQWQRTNAVLLIGIGGAAAVLQALFGRGNIEVSVWVSTAGGFAMVLVFYLATAHRTLRAIVTFAGIVATGMMVGIYIAVGLVRGLHLPSPADVALPGAGLPLALMSMMSWSLVAAIIGLFAVLGFVPLLIIERWLRRGWLSDTSTFVALALTFLFASVMMTSKLALAPRLALLALWLAAVGAAYGAALRASRWPRKARSLLVLRVFSRDHRAEKVLDALQSRWQLAGPVVQIGGPDLMALNFGLGQFIRFATFRVAHLFQATAEQARGLSGSLDSNPDLEGRFRLHEVFCTNSAWRIAVEQLVDRVDAVLLDLRGFGKDREGTIYEVELLARRGRLAQTVGLFDADTDWACFERHAAAAGALQALAGRIDACSPHAINACFKRLLAIADLFLAKIPSVPEIS